MIEGGAVTTGGDLWRLGHKGITSQRIHARLLTDATPADVAAMQASFRQVHCARGDAQQHPSEP